mmetsp:Transcript_68518/g.135413  ORF Transcript_68518/g.135413 Transcript_68518/m.135413 type:complete len:359 (+) Transcript_68518:29-1105(+)
MPHLSAAKLQQLKTQFRKVDTSGDGSLDFKEMSTLLRRGNQNLTDLQLKALFNGADKNNDGRISFEEFCTFIYNAQAQTISEQPAPEAPADVESVFQAFAGGSTMDGVRFAKACRDCGLLDARQFTTRDVDTTFAKFSKGKRQIQYPDFLRALVAIAGKKEIAVSDIYSQVGDSAPKQRATKPDAVRFHDDKSTYTGVHAKNLDPGGGLMLELLDEPSPRPQRPSITERRSSLSRGRVEDERHEGDDAGEVSVNAAFYNYTSKSDDCMDGGQFCKVCVDCGLVDANFSRGDVDVVFANVCFRGERKIGIGQFEDALKEIARRKDVAIYFVRKAVASSKGPRLRATRIVSPSPPPAARR